MMKKRIAVFLLIITIVLSYTGCATPSDTGDSTEKPGVHTTHPPEESQGKNILSESAIKTDVKGLYSWENGVSYKTYNHDVSISDDVLRMEFITPGLDTFSMDIVQYSLSEDKV